MCTQCVHGKRPISTARDILETDVLVACLASLPGEITSHVFCGIRSRTLAHTHAAGLSVLSAVSCAHLWAALFDTPSAFAMT